MTRHEHNWMEIERSYDGGKIIEKCDDCYTEKIIESTSTLIGDFKSLYGDFERFPTSEADKAKLTATA